MKKKVVSALLCATMVATMFAGCGSKESSDNATTPDTSKADTSSEVTAPAEVITLMYMLAVRQVLQCFVSHPYRKLWT